MKNFLSISVVTLFSFVLLSCGGTKQKKAKEPMVQVEEIMSGASAQAMSFTGKTKSASDVNLSFRTSGQIMKLNVREGDHVSRGQVVAVMDPRDYQVQLAATQAEYEQIKADAERIFALYEEGNTTASNYDKARYGLQQISQKLANHRNQLSDTQLRSPIDGYVQKKLHEQGETVGSGMPVITVFESGDTEVEINVSASDFANMDEINNFYCTFDVTGEEEYPLAISNKSQEANASQLYTVRLKFVSNIDNTKITPGMTTMVYAVNNSSDAPVGYDIPSTALLHENGKSYVFVYDEKSSKVKRTEVNVMNINRDGSATVGTGVKQGTSIVVKGVHHIKDGQKVRKMEHPSISNVGNLI